MHVRNPLVDMDGDEMTRVIWKEVQNSPILPPFYFIDADIRHYDLGCPIETRRKRT